MMDHPDITEPLGYVHYQLTEWGFPAGQKNKEANRQAS